MDFTNKINTNNPKFSPSSIDFLDLVISQKENKFQTSTHFKSVDTNSYIEFTSNHFRKWKINIPFGQFRRNKKNCSSTNDFEEQAGVISKRFEEKGYPRALRKEALMRARCLSQTELLTIKDKTVHPTLNDPLNTKINTK